MEIEVSRLARSEERLNDDELVMKGISVHENHRIENQRSALFELA